MAKIFETISQNKKTIILALGIGLFLVFVPLYSAEALEGVVWRWVGRPIIGALGSVIFGLLSLIIGAFVLISGLLASLVASLAIWMIETSLNVPIIASEIVQTGWTFTRDFVNMFFILILVFIGLATILKINEYEAKKILPLLIIIALLINFSTVLVGFVVDISNIITNFFLNKFAVGGIAGLAGPVNQSIDFFEGILGALWEVFAGDKPKTPLAFEPIAGHFAKGIVLVIFNLFSAMILFILFLLFFARIIALWILTILAPLAFACYVLPNTRSLWKEWWQQLLQWAMIGIPISFFLYLAIFVQKLGLEDPAFIGIPAPDPAGNIMVETFNVLLSPIVSLAILIVGITISFRFVPAAANKVIDFGKSVPGKLAKTRMGQKTLGGLAKGTQKALARTSPFMRRMEERAGKVPGIGKALRPLTALTTRPIGLASKGINRLAGPGLIQYAAEREKITTPKGFEAWSGPQQEAWAEANGLSSKDRLAVADKMGDNLEYTSKDFQDKIKADATSALLKRDPSYQKEAKAVAKTFPDIITEAVLTNMKSFGKTGEAETEAIEKVKENLETTIKHISNALSDEDLAIEAGLKLKYITKKMVSDDKDNAAREANKKLTDDEKKKFLRDTAAGANYIREFKGSDIGKMADTKNLAARTGLVLGNSANLQRVRDEHGMAALEDVFDGPGGLNSMADAPEKLEKFYEKNPNMVRALMTNPALRQMNWEGRNQMTDPNGQKTTNFRDFERRKIIQKRIEKEKTLSAFYNHIREANKYSQKTETARKRGRPTQDLEDLYALHASRLTEIWEDNIEGNDKLRREWKEIEELRRGPQKQQRRRQGRRP